MVHFANFSGYKTDIKKNECKVVLSVACWIHLIDIIKEIQRFCLWLLMSKSAFKFSLRLFYALADTEDDKG